MNELVIKGLGILVGLIVIWGLYLKMLDRVTSPSWDKPEWLSNLLLFVVPILPGVIACLVSHNWFVGLLYSTPWDLSMILLILWFREQRTVAKRFPQRR